MEQAGLHQGLALRLEVLANRIRTLKDKMSRAEGLQKIEGLAGIERLERRYDELKNHLDELNREGPGFRHGMKRKLERLSADLFGALDDFIMRTDSRYSPEKPPAQASKPPK
jgi:chaperonin cofactor prefoldin